VALSLSILGFILFMLLIFEAYRRSESFRHFVDFVVNVIIISSLFSSSRDN
jgi:hypothetical protein